MSIIISDTLRTDDRTIYNEHGEWVSSAFARQLERELNAEKQHITELEGRLRVLWDKLEGERMHYNDRIKRLEEAGDEMERWRADHVSSVNWRKAKETKP